jgi:hypothetical protein
MIIMEKTKVIQVLKHVNNMLVEKEYEKLYEEDFMKDGDYESLWLNIKEYGGHITMPSEEALNNPKLLEIEDDEAMIEFDLWVDGEESDLTISLLVIKNENDTYQFNVEEIHIQ